jgi:predicted O-methyltransferase YrrM
VRYDADYTAFLKIYARTAQTILQDVPFQSRRSCEMAFAEAETCYLLYRTIRDKIPLAVIETGSFLGLATLVCAAALQENHLQHGIHGRIYSISLDSFYRVERPLTRAAYACRKLVLSKYVHFIEGSSVPLAGMESADLGIAQQRSDYLRNRLIPENRESLLHRLVTVVGKVDVAFLDALHYEAVQMTEISALLDGLGENGCLFIDDVLLSRRKDDLRHLVRDWLHLDFHTYRLLDFIRCGFRFYYAPWIVDTFRWSNLARVTLFKKRDGFLRAIKLEMNPHYCSPYGRLATWYSAESLEEFLAKYELKDTNSNGVRVE